MPANTALKTKIEKTLREQFPNTGETVDVSDGWETISTVDILLSAVIGQ